MATHVATYECEWKAALASPERLDRFVTFANTPTSDSTLVFVRERSSGCPRRPRPFEATATRIGLEKQVRDLDADGRAAQGKCAATRELVL